MDLSEAKNVVSNLIAGINPLTGEFLPSSDSCNQPDVIRALYLLLNAVQEKSEKTKSEKPQPENAGKPWTEEEDALLCQMFDEGTKLKELCEFNKRTSGAIKARLVRLGKIDDRSSIW